MKHPLIFYQTCPEFDFEAISLHYKTIANVLQQSIDPKGYQIAGTLLIPF